MFSLSRPTPRLIQELLEQQARLPFSYTEVGASAQEPPATFQVDHNRICLGKGREVFEKACTLLQEWEMMNLGWLSVSTSPNSPAEGDVVAIIARSLGIWVLSFARVVYTIDEKGETDRFGFAYGTLPKHVERGEERFLIEWNHSDDTVWYDILAFSRPAHILTWLAYPWTRREQKRFARHSKAVMLQSVQRCCRGAAEVKVLP